VVWAGKDKINLTVTDVFDGFDATVEGDSGTIARSIGSGPVDVVSWVIPLQRLLLGGETSEYSIRSSVDEPLTPSNFNIKPVSSQGAAPVSGVRVDSRGMFVQGGGTRLFELALSSTEAYYDYSSTDLTILVPDIGGDIGSDTHIVRIAVQRQPDTRIHCVRSDGLVAVLVYDSAEKITCWLKVESPGADGLIEDVVVLPAQSGQREDQVYYVVQRTVNGSTVRYLEKWALESECLGGTLNKQMDSFVTFTGATASASHLEGEDVVVWADGACLTDSNGDIRTFTVSSGSVSMPASYTSGVMGLAYEATWQGAKLGQSLNRRKKIEHLGLILDHTHIKGLRFGPSLTDAEMDYMPLTSNGEVMDADHIYTQFDETSIPFPGQWDTDSRLCLKAEAPLPCTILAATINADVTV